MNRTLTMALFILFAVNLVLPATAAEIMTGVLTDVTGNVEIMRRGEKQWQKAAKGMPIKPGDKISTGISGSAVLSFENSLTEITPMTQFVIGRTVEDSQKFYTELFLQVGKVVTEVNAKSGKQNRFNVTTPSAVAGIRGSKQEVGHFPQTGTEMKMLEGHGFMAPQDPNKLPGAMKEVLGLSPQKAGGEEGGKDKDKEKKDDEKGEKNEKSEKDEKGEKADEGGRPEKDKEDRSDEAGRDIGTEETPKEAVGEFNQWLQENENAIMEAGAAEEKDIGLLDEKTMDFVQDAGKGHSVEIRDAQDPAGIVDADQKLAKDATPDVTPAGMSASEKDAATVSTETVDQPAATATREEQKTLTETTRAAEQDRAVEQTFPGFPKRPSLVK